MGAETFRKLDRQKYHMVELLSPAGSIEGFYGAVSGGADAIYLAGNRFGARAYAENFSTEELVACIRYAHLLGRKIYMTVNTLLKEEELGELYEYLLPFYEAGLDAVIVQDLGVLRFVREHFPDMEIHVSTQMTLCSGYGASLLKEMGASRIVPARELGLKELAAMKQEADIEIETFIHGAMCYCYSGQCLFSSILGGRSGNRGRCAQPCRLPYTVTTRNVKKENCYPLSLKDMCTIEHIPALIEAGIDSFKIEGRMKKPEYTAGVTDIYRRCIDKYYNLREKMGVEEAARAYAVSKKDSATLRSLYIRSDIQDGYYFKHNGSEMVTILSPAYSGSDDALLEKVHEKFLSQRYRLPISVDAGFVTGECAWVTLNSREVSVVAQGDVVQAAQKQPVTEENITKQLNKMGDTAFLVSGINVFVSEDAFYPLKQINELRRQAVELLENELLKVRGYADRANADSQTNHSKNVHRKESYAGTSSCFGSGQKSANGYTVFVRTVEQLNALAEWMEENSFASLFRLYIEGDLLMDSLGEVKAVTERLNLSRTDERLQIWIVLPYIIRHSDKEYLKTLYKIANENTLISGFLVRSMDGFGFLKSMDSKFPCRGDVGVYAWNEAAFEELAKLVEGFCLPYELKASEQRSLANKYSCEKIVYSRIPMMITANCLLKTVDKCNKNNQELPVLTDRYRKNFKVLRNCRHCYNVIYNSVPLSLHQELHKWRERTDLRMDFTYENADEVKELLDCFVKGTPFPKKDYTTGHEKRGVE